MLQRKAWAHGFMAPWPSSTHGPMAASVPWDVAQHAAMPRMAPSAPWHHGTMTAWPPFFLAPMGPWDLVLHGAMGIIVTIANLKGGVGKSTLTLGLGGACLELGKRVLIVDADEQATVRHWAKQAAISNRPRPFVMNLGEGQAMSFGLLELRDQWDVILVDLPARLGAETTAAMGVAQAVLMPLAPSPPDVWALQQTLAKLQETYGYNPKLQARAVWNRVGRTAVGRTIVAQLEGHVAIAKATVRDRVAHVEAFLAGRTVTDYAPSSDAEIDLRNLAQEVLTMTGAASG